MRQLVVDIEIELDREENLLHDSKYRKLIENFTALGVERGVIKAQTIAHAKLIARGLKDYLFKDEVINITRDGNVVRLLNMGLDDEVHG